MALDFRVAGFGFGPTTEKEHVLIGPVDFGMTVTRAEVALKGFISQFVNDDHELFIHKILTRVDRIEGSKVFVEVTFLLRDHSGNIDDSYSGAVHVLVFADVTPRIRPPVFIGRKAKGNPRSKARARRARAKA